MKDQGKISEEEYNTAKAEVDEGLHFEKVALQQTLRCHIWQERH